jgi:predicted GNAT superfamily acetyltransferase
MADMSHAVALADEHCRAALAAAGVRMREASNPEDLDQLLGIFDTVWGMTAPRSVLPPEELRVYRLTGQYLQLAEDAATGQVIAASLALFAAPAGTTLHSHITGVLPEALGRSVGFAIKLHQRHWALTRGLNRITWTFDPLQARNAWFNLAKLGARPVGYLVDVYGAMSDAINAGDSSDRLHLDWPLADPEVTAAVAAAGATTGTASSRQPGAGDLETLQRNGFAVQVAVAADGRTPLVHSPDDTAPGRLVQVPASIDALRREDSGLARDWRHAVRDALLPALEQGWRVGVARGGWYVLQPGPVLANPANPTTSGAR